jgi:sodium pump decarboxylase gamma subunit
MSIEMQEGIIILVIGMGVVFLSLILLHQVFERVVPAMLALGNREKKAAPEAHMKAEAKTYKTADEITAIAAAIYLFLEETHDEENAILTISKSSKNYSPWSSKIYTTHKLATR